MDVVFVKEIISPILNAEFWNYCFHKLLQMEGFGTFGAGVQCSGWMEMLGDLFHFVTQMMTLALRMFHSILPYIE